MNSRAIGVSPRFRSIRDEDRAPLDAAVVHGLEDVVDLGERPGLDEGFERDLAIEHQVERGGVEFGRAAPVADRPRVERHQVGEADLDLVHREAHDR
ncbi:MAG: hypothetical protein M5U08_17865 [Burkholderiales bacterium]|nr:hypothetical protein [Burkholderiales bacterium]